MTAAPAIGASTVPVRRAGAVVGSAALLAVLGAVLSLVVLAPGHERPDVVRDAPPSGVWDGSASFGPVSVQRLERFADAPHAAGGHGGSQAGADRIRVFVTTTNRRSREVPFSPGQFRLRFAGTPSSVPPTHPNPPPDSIAAGQTVSSRLDFVVPAGRSSFTLVFADVGRASPLAIGLGALAPQRKE